MKTESGEVTDGDGTEGLLTRANSVASEPTAVLLIVRMGSPVPGFQQIMYSSISEYYEQSTRNTKFCKISTIESA